MKLRRHHVRKVVDAKSRFVGIDPFRLVLTVPGPQRERDELAVVGSWKCPQAIDPSPLPDLIPSFDVVAVIPVKKTRLLGLFGRKEPLLTRSRAPRTIIVEDRERSSTASFEDSHDRPAGHKNSCLPCLSMMRTHRVRRSYDHRLRDAIAATGNADLFRNVTIPASTRRTWARGEIRPVVASVDVELEVYELLEQVDSLRQRAKVHAAIIGLLVRVLRLRGGKFDADRVPDGETKSSVLRAIASATGLLSLSTVLRIVGISSARYHAWRRKEDGCGLDDQPSCPKSFPSQLTRDEVSTMRDFVESESYRHVAVQNLAVYSQRLGKLFASLSTWYKMIRERGWKRPRRRVHPAKPEEGLRATRPNQYWQIDATVIRLTTGIRIYLQAVIDNFSRSILAWRVSDMLSSATTRELLIEASKGLPDESANANIVVVTDGGTVKFRPCLAN